MRNRKTLANVETEFTGRFPAILAELNCSLLVSSYRAGQLITISSDADSLSLSFVSMQRPTGIAVSPSLIAIGSERYIEFWKNVDSGCRVGSRAELQEYDSIYVPTKSIYTGNIHVHELAWLKSELWFANTRFSALCTLSNEKFFDPKWKPKFISELVDQDLCHLNGLCVAEGKPQFVTALGATNTKQGWREHKNKGGVVVDVAANEIVCSELCMPHSPRVHDGRSWVLNSGAGEFGRFCADSGTFETITVMPGFLRGLSFVGKYAFVGLSLARESTTFGGLPILSSNFQLRCGIGVVDLESGKTIAVLKFLEGIEEIFSVEVIPNCRNPLFDGSIVNGENPREVWFLPDGSTSMQKKQGIHLGDNVHDHL